MTEVDFKRLAAFRLALREFQFFSEQASEAQGLTTQQYQALLAIKGEVGDAPFTVSLLSQRLLVKHNSAVGLVDRMAQLGLVERRPSPVDRRSVVIAMTARGEAILRRLAKTHREELHRIAPELGRHVRAFARPRAPPA